MMETGMPSTYDNEQGGSSSAGLIDKSFPTSLPAILLAVEITFSLVTFICASVSETFVEHHGGGWVQFVSITAFIIGIIVYVLYLFLVMHKLPAIIPRHLIEFIYYATWTTFYFISGIVAAVVGSYDDAVAACAFFAFASMVVYGIDTFMKFMAWRAQPKSSTSTTTATTVTTTSTTYNEGPQY